MLFARYYAALIFAAAFTPPRYRCRRFRFAASFRHFRDTCAAFTAIAISVFEPPLPPFSFDAAERHFFAVIAARRLMPDFRLGAAMPPFRRHFALTPYAMPFSPPAFDTLPFAFSCRHISSFLSFARALNITPPPPEYCHCHIADAADYARPLSRLSPPRRHCRFPCRFVFRWRHFRCLPCPLSPRLLAFRH